MGILYDVIDAGDDDVAALKREGFTGFPVVKVNCGDGAEWSWCGYRHDDIKRLAQLFE